MPRTVRLVLCDHTGTPYGVLPPFEVAGRWWPEAAPVRAAALAEYGVEVVLLRLLGGDRPPTEDGATVTYLAESTGPLPGVPLEPPPAGVADPHPLRLPYAEPGGVLRLVAWADAALAERGTPRTGPVEQVRTWNLSCLLRLPVAGGAAWCKAVPRFFAHEPVVLRWLTERGHADLVPPVLATGDAVTLLGEVPGIDDRDPPVARMEVMVQRLVAFQAETAGRLAEVAALGLPDWREGPLYAAVRALVERPESVAALTADERAGLAALVAELPGRLAALRATGLPDTLVHGDFHTGNWRWDGRRLVLLDWGDTGLGHPLLDMPAFLEPVADPAVRERVTTRWCDAWSAAVPGADPRAAVELIAPVAALRQALIYRTFLDQIEPAERVYHETDVPYWLRAALAAGGMAPG